jgi:branched-chain amino acid transport system permease protein
MRTVLPYIISGISVGGQYALIAIGYTMVYGILRLINFAHGDVVMVAGLVMVYLAASMPLYVAILVMILLTVLLGFTIERVAYKPLRTAPRMSVMISAIGVSYLLQNLALYITGGLNKNYPAIPWISDRISIFGMETTRVTVITPFLTILLVVLLVLLINHTKIGMAMRAVSLDFEVSQLMGIQINRVISATFNYLVNLHFVFDGERRRRSFAKYALLAVCIMAASYLLTAAAIDLFPAAAAHVVLTKASVDLFLFLVSFAVQRLFIFAR